MISLKPTLSLNCRAVRVSNNRRRAVHVAARSKDEIDEEWRAQQELLAFRRKKAEAARMATDAMNSGKRVSVKGAMKSVGKSTSSARPAPAAKTDPALIIEDDSEKGKSGGGNPLGFLGKLFGK